MITHDKLLHAIAINAGYNNIWDYIEQDKLSLKHGLEINTLGHVWSDNAENLEDWLIDCGAFMNKANGRYYLYGIELF